MDNYQPKYYDPAITLPFIADKHRHLGNRFYNFDDGQKLSVEVGQDELFRKRKYDADMMANAKVQSTLSAQQKMLQPRHPRLIPYNRSGQPFFTNVDQTNKNLNVVSGGTGTLTYSVRLSDADREARRKKILERLGNNYEKFKSGDISEDVRQPQIYTPDEAKENEGKLLLDLIIERVQEGDFKYELINDLFKVQNYFINNVWKWNDYKTFDNFIDKLELLLQALQASMTEDIIEGLKNRRRNYIDLLIKAKINEGDLSADDEYRLGNAEEDYEQIAENYGEAITRYLSTAFNMTQRLYKFLKINAKGIGQNEKLRKQLVKASLSELKLSDDYKKSIPSSLLKSLDLLQKEERTYLDDLNIPIPEVLSEIYSDTRSTRSTISTNTTSTSSSGNSSSSSDSSSSGRSYGLRNLFNDQAEFEPVEEEAPPEEEEAEAPPPPPAPAGGLTRRALDGLTREQLIAFAKQRWGYKNRDPNVDRSYVRSYIIQKLGL